MSWQDYLNPQERAELAMLHGQLSELIQRRIALRAACEAIRTRAKARRDYAAKRLAKPAE